MSNLASGTHGNLYNPNIPIIPPHGMYTNVPNNFPNIYGPQLGTARFPPSSGYPYPNNPQYYFDQYPYEHPVKKSFRKSRHQSISEHSESQTSSEEESKHKKSKKKKQAKKNKKGKKNKKQSSSDSDSDSESTSKNKTDSDDSSSDSSSD